MILYKPRYKHTQSILKTIYVYFWTSNIKNIILYIIKLSLHVHKFVHKHIKNLACLIVELKLVLELDLFNSRAQTCA